jgi:hypothetical protein
MSLTSHLKNPNSTVRKFMRERFPNTRRVMALSRGQMGERPTCRPNGPVPWSLIGTALDYRLRFYFPQTGGKASVEDLICFRGAAKACGGSVSYAEDNTPLELLPPADARTGCLDHGLLINFFASLKDCLKQNPPQQRLDSCAEDELLRHCVIMAALDCFFRSSRNEQSFLLFPKRCQTLAELLAVAERAWLDDLLGLSWDFCDTFPDLWSQPAALNPTFDGSGFVGGADADLIVNGCLIDFKTTIHPLKDNDWIYQLLGYVLLDWHDENMIDHLAVYFARQSYLLKWNVSELLVELTGDVDVTLEGIRQEWYDVVHAQMMLPNETEFDRTFAGHMGYVMQSGRWKCHLI